MINLLKRIFGMGPQVNYKELVSKGACIIDVRTRSEYSSGHIRNSLNIPLNELQSSLNKIPKGKAVITCCASGMRSAAARSVLTAAGFEEVYNGGGWMSLNGKIEN